MPLTCSIQRMKLSKLPHLAHPAATMYQATLSEAFEAIESALVFLESIEAEGYMPLRHCGDFGELLRSRFELAATVRS